MRVNLRYLLVYLLFFVCWSGLVSSSALAQSGGFDLDALANGSQDMNGNGVFWVIPAAGPPDPNAGFRDLGACPIEAQSVYSDGTPPDFPFSGSCDFGSMPSHGRYESPHQTIENGQNVCFGPCQVKPQVVYAGVAYPGDSFASFTQGTTICGVYQNDPNNPGKFLPVPTATIYFAREGNDPQAKSYVAMPRALNGGMATYATFGLQPQGGLGTPPDAPYPSGLQSQPYHFFVTANGFKPVSSFDNTVDSVGGKTGADWVGKGIIFILASVSSSASSTATTTPDQSNWTPTTSTTGTGTGSTGSTGIGSTGGTGTGSTSDTDFFSSFWDKLKAFFFDPVQAKTDLAAAQATGGQLLSYGPLGLPAQFKQQFDDASALFNHTPANDPNYWVFPTFSQLPGIAPGASMPDDFNPNQTFTSSTDPALMANFNKLTSAYSGWDLSPYRTFVLFVRFFVLGMTWFFYLRAQVARFTPEVKI